MLAIEFVLIGYVDRRIDMPIPFGFAIKHGRTVSVHHRMDIVKAKLPDVFEFIVRNLPEVIVSKWSQVDNQAADCGLYEFLCQSTFHSLGDLRCWQPSKIECQVEEFEKYLFAFRKLVDGQMLSYRQKLAEFDRECSPTWTLFPAPIDIEMPRLEPSLV